MTEDLKKAIADYFGYKSYDDMDTSDRAMAEFVATYKENPAPKNTGGLWSEGNFWDEGSFWEDGGGL